MSFSSIVLNKSILINLINLTTTRCLATHWDPKWRKLRREKVKYVNLPKFDKIREEVSASFEEQRSRSKKEGLDPPISFEYKPLNITSSSEVFDPYVPPEGDGKRSILSQDGLKQRFLKLKSSGSTWNHIRKIKNYEDNFDALTFAEDSQRIFIEAHEALCKRDSDKLIELVTESCYTKMWSQNKYKTVRWKWIQALESTEVVKIITREMLSKSNIFAQITVRMHSQQTLAVYDRFGRLAYGDEDLVKNVLEYVVFEKNLTNKYGVWRIHDKIIPEWSEPKMPIIRTYYKPKSIKIEQNVEPKKSEFKNDEKHLDDIKDDKKLALS